jgi:hypothetical protein
MDPDLYDPYVVWPPDPDPDPDPSIIKQIKIEKP